MSRQQEDFKKLAADMLKRAERESGPYREVLLGVAEAYAALAYHQGVFETWPQKFPFRLEPHDQAGRQVASEPFRGRQANENGRPSRPFAAA
jgi:hypothetical protein